MNTVAGATGTVRASSLRLLVVEDDPADVALIENAIAAQNLPTDLHVVSDGEEAMAFLHRRGVHADAPRPDLIMLDLNMPRVDGREVLTAVKADNQLKPIPVVVFTTSTVDVDVLASYSAHANAYVTKPLDLHTFERVVSDIHRFYSTIASLPPGLPDRE
ncbi:response regulator [Micromonospora sp. NPDC051141]|uniref:response regulator n=1 Tax=Micromonospora sp. NPDC051141 TaxID=3364284 RepID=UPI0037AD8823